MKIDSQKLRKTGSEQEVMIRHESEAKQIIRSHLSSPIIFTLSNNPYQSSRVLEVVLEVVPAAVIHSYLTKQQCVTT